MWRQLWEMSQQNYEGLEPRFPHLQQNRETKNAHVPKMYKNTMINSKEHVAFTTRKFVKSSEWSKPFVPTYLWSPTFLVQETTDKYCYWWLTFSETASFCGKLRSSWILCMSSSVDMSVRSPINSSVSCRRASLRRETHKLQLKLLVTKLQLVRSLINLSPFCKSELVAFPPLSPPAVSLRLSNQRLHAQDQSASRKPGHKFIYTFEDAC